MPSKFVRGNGCRIHGNTSINQSNNYLHQIQSTPTQRRGPIAAEFSSPGPAIVLLPSAFGTNTKSPAYSFGAKHEDKKDIKTPGPGEYDVEGLTRNGKDWTPSAFVGARHKEPEPFNTPSPTQYFPEKSIYNAKGRQAPSYTFGYRAKDSVIDITPAPTAYNVPEPDAYKIQKQPMYTFRLKTEIPCDKTRKPGPADYKTEKVWIDKNNSPNVTFGSRPSPFAHSF